MKHQNLFRTLAIATLLFVASPMLTSCSDSEARDANNGNSTQLQQELRDKDAEIAKLREEKDEIERKWKADSLGCEQRAKEAILNEQLEERAASAAAGLHKIDLSMLTSFATNDSDALSATGLIQMVKDLFDGETQSPISTPRTSLGLLLPSLSGGRSLPENDFLAIKKDFRNPQRVNKFWNENKGLVITALKLTGQLGTVSAHATELLKYYEGKIDKDLADKCKAYYDKHKNAESFEFESLEYKNLAGVPADAGDDASHYWFGPKHAALENWLFVQRNRDAGGEALIQAHIRVLRDLANPA